MFIEYRPAMERLKSPSHHPPSLPLLQVRHPFDDFILSVGDSREDDDHSLDQTETGYLPSLQLDNELKPNVTLPPMLCRQKELVHFMQRLGRWRPKQKQDGRKEERGEGGGVWVCGRVDELLLCGVGTTRIRQEEPSEVEINKQDNSQVTSPAPTYTVCPLGNIITNKAGKITSRFSLSLTVFPVGAAETCLSRLSMEEALLLTLIYKCDVDGLNEHRVDLDRRRGSRYIPVMLHSADDIKSKVVSIASGQRQQAHRVYHSLNLCEEQRYTLSGHHRFLPGRPVVLVCRWKRLSSDSIYIICVEQWKRQERQICVCVWIVDGKTDMARQLDRNIRRIESSRCKQHALGDRQFGQREESLPLRVAVGPSRRFPLVGNPCIERSSQLTRVWRDYRTKADLKI
ncbi:hypothetical protein BLNAU_22212 [Blattamonas nauphoetae]|uniref:Uncharacterized protein n=1 Tax=Blattamonas nauphoetae TaxID=2049346 RepID=A0ABQ9WU89_9EUKA|nr:hypothetical protein BLNAU_22212 [Blattamonas nauphoetae]